MEFEVNVAIPRNKNKHVSENEQDEIIEEAAMSPPKDAEPPLMLRLHGFTRGTKSGSRRKLK